METKYVRVPFEVELAKKITEKSVEGRIVTRNGESARIVCFDRKDEFRPIIALVNSGDIEVHYVFSLNGKFVNDYVLDTHDLMLEIPEYMTFKDGDVLTYRPSGNRWCIFIYKGNDFGLMHNYVTYDCDSSGNNILTFGKSSYVSTLCESSTEDEKQSLIDALKASKDPRAKEYLKRFFPNHSNSSNIGKNYDFKPFDKVLGRECETDRWRADLFSHMNEEGEFICIGYVWEQCIPYNDKTAHLLGTKEKYE